MSEPFTFSIGHDMTVTVRDWEELFSWLDKERGKWSWLTRGDGRTDRFNVAGAIHNTWDNMLAELNAVRNNGQSLSAATPHLSPLWAGPLLVSTTPEGSTILDILQTSGDMSASYAVGFVKGMYGINNAQTPADLKGAMLTVVSGLDSPADLSALLKNERANFKNATRSMFEKVDSEARSRNEENAKYVKRLADIGRRKYISKRDKWASYQEKWQVLANDAVSEIRGTENTYKEFMKLKAPATYWTDKAKEHGKKEDTARTKLLWYFPITGILGAIIFGSTAAFLLAHPDTTSSKAPIALYVVISGGLLLLSTLAFWVGRLLTKLYLSEHHLRNDAEERAVMATTYLALSHEGIALEADRQVVLAAMFRATPDGIVKEEGPPDMNVQGLLSKALTR